MEPDKRHIRDISGDMYLSQTWLHFDFSRLLWDLGENFRQRMETSWHATAGFRHPLIAQSRGTGKAMKARREMTRLAVGTSVHDFLFEMEKLT